MIQHDVGYALNVVVPGDRHDGYRETPLARRVHGNEPLDRPPKEELRILVDQVGLVTVADDEVKIPLLQKVVLTPANHPCGISLAHFRHHHSNGKTALLPEGAS